MRLKGKITALLTFASVLIVLLSLSVSAASLKPSKPVGVKAVSVSADKVSLSWKKTVGADYYRVYVKRDGRWKALENPKTNSCEIAGLTASKTYDFAVRSVNKEGSKSHFCEGYTSLRVKTKVLSATRLSVSVSADYADLSWKKVPGATGYYAYLKSGDKWVRIKTLPAKTTTLHIGSLKPDTLYSFCVRPITTGDGKALKGPESNKPRLKTLRANKVEARVTFSDTASVSLKWSKAPDATGYKIFVKEGEKWKGVKTVYSKNTLGTVVASLESDSKYSFLVRAFKKTKGEVLWFVSGKELIATTDPAEKDLKVKRTKALSKLLKGEAFTLSYKLQTASYGDLPVKIYKKGNKYRLDSRLNEMTYTLLNLGNTDYALLPEEKAYAVVPSKFRGATDIKTAVEALLPDDGWTRKATLATFNGSTVVCESFTDILKTKALKYYYRAGELVGIEEYNLIGKLTERAFIAKLTPTADVAFKVPKDYKKLI